MMAPRLQALMGRASIREAREGVQTAAGASVATAYQSVAADAPGLARTAANLTGASSTFGDTAESRYCETKFAFITLVAAAHAQRSHLLPPKCGISVTLAD